MTSVSPSVQQRRLPVVDVTAPAERLAALRIVAGAFTLGYLLIRLPVFLQLANRSTSSFDGVGILALAPRPLPAAMTVAAIGVTILAGFGFVAGVRFRVCAPVFAAGMLVLTTYRGSWGQLLHFENLMVLHLIVLAASPAADAWSVDARRGSTKRHSGESTRYGWPVALVGLVTVVTYVIAGLAKLRYGGADWIVGDTLRNHIAYSATRLDLIGGTPAPLADVAVRNAWALTPMAAASVVLELAAPVAFLGGRVRNAWVACTWLMHAAIFALMFVGFPSPLFGVAFAPFFKLESVPAWARRVGRPM